VNYTTSNLDASELLRRIGPYLEHPLKRQELILPSISWRKTTSREFHQLYKQCTGAKM